MRMQHREQGIVNEERNSLSPAGPRRLFSVVQSFLIALAFLTVLPVRLRRLPSNSVVAVSRLWYPVVGLLLGASLGFAAYGLLAVASPGLTAFLVLALWVIATGALHLDGLADLADGLFGGRDPQERLKIMRDPQVGTFGVLACVLVLLGKFVLLQELATRDREAMAHALAASVLVARCGILLMAGLSRYPRPEGTGKAVIAAAGLADAIVGIILAVLLNRLFGPACGCAGVLCAASWALLVVLVLTWLGQRRLGGVTGDCLGAGVEMAEMSYLLAAVIRLQ